MINVVKSDRNVRGQARQPADSTTSRVSGSRGWRQRLRSQGLLAILIALMVFFTARSEFFLTQSNLFTVATGATALGIMAAAQTPLIIAGGFDVSVGSVVAMTTVCLGIFLANGIPSLVAIALVLLVAAAIGAINGFIVVNLGVNPLITTLGTMSIFSGMAFLLSTGQTQVVLDPVLTWITDTRVVGIPVLLILLALVFAVALVIERKTVLGRYIFAIGGNREAARLAGVAVLKVPFLLFVTSSLSAGVAGVIVTGQLGSASPQVGPSYMLAVVTAVILGGTSLTGGRGSVLGTLIAVLLLGVLQNGFALLELPSYVQTVALGVALILAVLIDQTTQRLER